jgi:MFS family permease
MTPRELFWLSASVGVSMLGLGIIWPLVPLYALDLGASGFEVGVIIASLNVARGFSAPIVGWLSDRGNRKVYIAAGLMLFSLVAMLYTLTASVAALIGVRVIHGISSVFIVPVAMAMIAQTAPRHRLGSYVGTLSMAMMLGMGAGPVLGGFIKAGWGLSMAFVTMGALSMVTFLGILVFLPARIARSVNTAPQGLPPLGSILRCRYVQALFVVRFFSATGQGAVYTFLPILANRMALSVSEVGIILSVNIYLIAALQIVFGKIDDRHRPVPMMFGGVMFSGLAVASIPIMDSFSGILAAGMVMGVANGIAIPGVLVVAAKTGRRLGAGTITSLDDTARSLGFVAAPMLAGIILDTIGLAEVFYSGGALIMAGGVLSAILLKGYR